MGAAEARTAGMSVSPAGPAAGRVVTARRAEQVPPREPGEVPDAPTARNEVLLVGRVSGVPEARELPSGDCLVSFRLVVDRPAGARRPPDGVRATTVDTLDCTAWTPGLRRSARGLAAGDVVEVTGALRRRFWRAAGGAASRTEVEVAQVRRLGRPARS